MEVSEDVKIGITLSVKLKKVYVCVRLYLNPRKQQNKSEKSNQKGDRKRGSGALLYERERNICFWLLQEKILEMNLPMKLLYAEYLFGGTKLLYYFVSESRVDFRELVKELAKEFKIRIELRQVGVRDEAKIVGASAIVETYAVAGGSWTLFQ